MPVAGCQVGVARISGQMVSPVTDSLYLSAMLPSDFSIVFQPPMVVGQRPRGHLALAHARVQREGRAVANRGMPSRTPGWLPPRPFRGNLH
jgi:hypothetical protein